jgi:hypothetical protein
MMVVALQPLGAKAWALSHIDLKTGLDLTVINLLAIIGLKAGNRGN